MTVSPWKAVRGSLFGASLLLLLFGCAGQGPLIVKPPTVEVDRLVSLSIRPKVVKFDGTILIRNVMKTDLDLERVDWAVDLFDKELFSSSFNGLKRTTGGGTQAVSFPFQIEMKDIVERVTQARESVKIVFRGNLYAAGPFGFGPIPFRKILELPFPRIPEIAFKGTEGTPFADSFKIRLRITNTASFSFTINSVDAHLRAGGRSYRLRHAQNLEPIGPTGSREIELTMRDAFGEAPDPAPARLDLIGTVQCSTAFGWIFIPVTVEDLLK